MSIEKLISNIKQYQREIDILDVLNFVRGKTKNGCLFPKGWTAENFGFKLLIDGFYVPETPTDSTLYFAEPPRIK